MAVAAAVAALAAIDSNDIADQVQTRALSDFPLQSLTIPWTMAYTVSMPST
jgi:hypothetical protein